jgi:hypothetical protein
MVLIQDFEVINLNIDTPTPKPKCINGVMLKGYIVFTVISSFKSTVLTIIVPSEFEYDHDRMG